MTDKGKGKTKDYISQIKKDTENVKESKKNEAEDIEWDRQESEDEEEVQQQKKGVVVQQGAVGTDKPKKLKDVFGESTQTQKPKYNNKPKDG